MPAATRRRGGKKISAVTAPTGHPTTNAESQRLTKSARKPIFVNVTTLLTMKITKPVARTGKINLALPSMIPDLPLMRCDPKRDTGSRGMVNALLTRFARNMLEQSLKEFLALFAHDAWSTPVPYQLRHHRRSDRSRRLQSLHDGRARTVAPRCGGFLPECGHGERIAHPCADCFNRRTRRLRHFLSPEDIVARR